MKSETTASKWLASVLLAVVWVALTCWLGYIHYFVTLLCIATNIIGVLLGTAFYLVVYGVLGYVTAKHVTAWKQCLLLILLQTVLVFATALGSWMLDTMQLFRPWALLYVKEPVRTLLQKNDLGSFAIHYGLACAETVVLPLLAVGVNKIVRKIREKSTASPQKQ